MNRAFVFVLIATLFFSSMEIALKQITDSFSAMQINITRFLMGGLALIPFALRDLRRSTNRLTAACGGELALLGLLGIFISMTFFQMAVERAPASVVATLFCGNTAFVLFFAFVFLHARITGPQGAAIILAVAGIACIVAPFTSILSVEALVFAILAPITFALYAVLSTPLCRRHSGVIVTCGTFLLGSLEMIVVSLIAGIGPVQTLFESIGLGFLTHVSLFEGYTWGSLLGMLYVGIGVSGAGYACYFMAAEAASPFTASLVFFFKPVLAPFLAWLLLGEHIPLSMLLGIGGILAGSLCILIARLREMRVLRTVDYWRRRYRHRNWKHDYMVRHFEPHMLNRHEAHRMREIPEEERPPDLLAAQRSHRSPFRLRLQIREPPARPTARRAFLSFWPTSPPAGRGMRRRAVRRTAGGRRAARPGPSIPASP